MYECIIHWIRRGWQAATLAMLLMSAIMLCRAEPEAKKYGLAMLLADLALGWMFFHEKAVQWLARNWKFTGKLQKRTLLESLQAVGGMAVMSAFVALGAFILFAETCLPFQLNLK